MKLIEPNVDMLTQEVGVDAYNHHIAECARICYASSGDNDEGLIKNLLTNKHYSMFRHETSYYKIPYRAICDDTLNTLIKSEYVPHYIYDSNIYVAINGQFKLENLRIMKEIRMYNIDIIEATNDEIFFNNIFRHTFIVTTQISTSRELNRVSPNNIAEQSTRYCNFSNGKFGKEISICKPHWHDSANEELRNFANKVWTADEFDYFNALDLGLPAEDARGFLPLDTATKCAYTYSIKEWCHILALRYYGITGRPHPNAKIIAGMIRDELNQYYDVDKLMNNFGYKIN